MQKVHFRTISHPLGDGAQDNGKLCEKVHAEEPYFYVENFLY